jgi:hypothetical protein
MMTTIGARTTRIRVATRADRRSRRGRLRVAITGLAVATLLGACSGTSSSTDRSRETNPYFTAAFHTRVNAYTFGQDPSWTADGRVLSNEKDPTGTAQVYVSQVNGSHTACLTCGQPGPNGFPQERPQGDWILFCSWRGQTVTFGAPCLGGVGTDLYAMRPDGSHVTRLTGPGVATDSAGVPYDNYHPYWSPDGHQIVWTHLDFVDQQRGGTHWTILVANFAVDGGGTPHLTDLTPVAPSGNTAYETQPWAPDGSGVLYTAFTSNGDKASGWLNTELYFLRLHGHGTTPAHPQPVHLTDNHPGWDEQAVFTPDMKDVIWMSSRGSPTWYQTVVTAAQQTGYAPPLENETAGPMFVLSILDPGFHTDLYELDLSTHAIRRLTNRNEVIPEFYFDPTGTRLLWTNGERTGTFLGTFSLASRPTSLASRPTSLASRPTAVSRPSGPVARWVGAPAHGDRTPPLPERPATIVVNTTNLPTSVTESLALLETQLTALAHQLQGLPQGSSCCRPATG